MFQKLKDKLAEEVKQSSLKFPVSVQQITQAVSSSTSPNKSANSETTQTSKEKENEDVNESSSDVRTVSDFNSEYDGSFTTIDLRSPTPISRNRRSSSSSDLFPIYEFLPTRHNLQSDLESNSEFDDGSSIHQFTNVSKEILYEKYRNMLQKYHKYRGRFVDMRKYCLELEREHDKIKNVLTETQDKAIRRTKELKEQCTLEQTAKAHLEGVLRNELEERDLIISTLNTKIKLLKSGKDISPDEQQKIISDFLKNQVGCDTVHFSNSFQEVELLKDKIKNFELLLSKAKEAITTKTIQIKTLESRIESGKKELKASNEYITQLQNKIDLMKHKEEEALLSLAENKMVVHRELEAKEKHIKILEDKLSRYENETQKSKTKEEQTDATSNSEIVGLEEIRAKNVEIQSLKNELLQLKASQNADVNNAPLIELDFSSAPAKLDTEETNERLAKIEKLNLLLSEKKKELDVLRATTESEILHLNQVKVRQENEIACLKAEVSKMKEDLSDQSKIHEEISALNKSLCQMRDTLNEKDKQLKSHVETINKLQSELSSTNDKLMDSSKYQKMYEETLTNSKADKIIAEEMMKNVKNELNASQLELKNATSSIEKYESELKNKVAIIEEKKNMEKELLECKDSLKKITKSLKLAKKIEHEMHVQTANFLEEINKLKSKEDEYLNEIRKLKDDLSSAQELDQEVDRLRSRLEEIQQQSQKLLVENEMVKKENISFKERIEDLKNCVNELELSFLAKKNSLKEEQKLCETERYKLASLIVDMQKSTEKNTKLKSENARIMKSNEEMTEKIGKLFVENKSLNEKIVLFKEKTASVTDHIEKLKDLCQLSEDSLDESAILLTVFEKLAQKIAESNNVREETDILKSEADELKIKLEEFDNYRQKNEKLRLEKEELEDKLSEENGKFNELLLQYNQIQNDTEIHKQLREENEQTINDLKQKFALYTKISELAENGKEKIPNTNQSINAMNSFGEELSNFADSKKNGYSPTGSFLETSKSDLEFTSKSISSLSTSCRDVILLICSKLSDLRVQNEEMRKDVVYLRQLACDQSSCAEFSLTRLLKVVDNCGLEKESIRNEILHLRKEKEKLLDEIQRLENEIKSIKIDTEKNFQQRESLYKEKYSQEILEIVTGYEKRLAEKDNEYELLQNKMNLRNDRENTTMYQETKEVIQNLQEELTSRQDSYAELLVQHKNEVEELNKKLSDVKENYAKELRENDKKWRSCLDKKIDEVEDKYKDEINELTKEWATDRKPSNTSTELNAKDNEEFLEDSAKHSEDSLALKEQVQILTNELNNCKRSHWREIDLNLMKASYDNAQHSHVTLDDCTEMEYLRNILYKYMMGHQPMVLAKVLAAVVKFDNDQTEQILLREEQKQSLMGHLGFT